MHIKANKQQERFIYRAKTHLNDYRDTCALKTELVHHRRFSTHEQAQREIAEYIEIFYNRIRKQARLGYLRSTKNTMQKR